MRDALAALGIGLVATGVSVRYGWDVACIIVGGLIFTLAVIGAMRQ